MPTSPGFHSEFDISLYPKILHSAIRRISYSFYVTRHFRPVSVGNSAYYAILARPTDEFSVYINTDREIVILFSTYITFEVRTLDAFDGFYDILESKRVDRSLRFLVSADVDVVDKIKHYLDQNPEYPIIIPVNLGNLSSKDNNTLIVSVRKNYLLRDLFGYQNPLREETFFFGRQSVVGDVLDMAKSGQNSTLFGLRKSGKTSVIYAIQRKAKGFFCTVSVIDCQSPAIHAKSYSSLLSYIIGEIRSSLGMKRSSPSLGESIDAVAENFSNQMDAILGRQSGNILIMFDEVENISPKTAASAHWRDGSDPVYFWQIIRSYIQSRGRGKISVCLVGTNPGILELPKINNIANPIYLYAKETYIPNLSFDETREMVEKLGYFMGLEFPIDVISDMHKEYGGHPFFTRQICSKIHKMVGTNRPAPISQALFSRAKAEYRGQLENYIRSIIDDLRSDYPGEFGLLRSVVLGDLDELNAFGREAPELIEHLVGYGFIERRGDEFDIKFEAIKGVLAGIVGVPSDEGFWSEISRRRNIIEMGIRVSLYHWSRGVSSSDWSIIVAEALTNKRFEALGSLEPYILFSSKESPLYLSDLLGFLRIQRVLPYLDDRRSRVLESIDFVNKMRRDAHALIVNCDEMAALRHHLDLLELEFSQP